MSLDERGARAFDKRFLHQPLLHTGAHLTHTHTRTDRKTQQDCRMQGVRSTGTLGTHRHTHNSVLTRTCTVTDREEQHRSNNARCYESRPRSAGRMRTISSTIAAAAAAAAAVAMLPVTSSERRDITELACLSHSRSPAAHVLAPHTRLQVSLCVCTGCA